MAWTRAPAHSEEEGLAPLTDMLDPVLVPIGFAAVQVGTDGRRGQVIYCRGEAGSADGGCVDLVVEVEAAPEWRISDVRYWGFPSDRWHLAFPRGAGLTEQATALARTLPELLG